MHTQHRLLSLILAVLMAVLPALALGDSNVSREYDEALNAMMRQEYAAAAEKLSRIPYYLDSAQLCVYCRAHAKAADGDYSTAIAELQTLGSYKDAAECAAYFTARKAEAYAVTPGSYAVAADLYDQEKLHAFRDASERAEAIRRKLYQDGLDAQEAESWAQASEYFQALASYSDSRLRYSYTTGRMYEGAGEEKAVSWAYAAKCFDKAGSFLDSAERKSKCLETAYGIADRLIESQDFDGAKEIYDALDDLCDQSRLPALKAARAAAAEAARLERIAEADALLADGHYDEARQIYLEAGEPDQADEALYQKAAWLAKTGETEKAAGLYMSISGYKDSRTQHYLLGQSLAESDPETASLILLADRDYPGAADDLYRIALKAGENENYALSISVYSELMGMNDCTLRLMNDLYLYGLQLLKENEPEQAVSAFDSLQGVGSAGLYANAARYAAAEALENSGAYEAAAGAFDLIADYSDAAERANNCRYQLAREQKKNGEYLRAAQTFRKLGSFRDSETQEKECRYLQGGAYEKQRLWQSAIDIYTDLGDYAKSKARCRDCYRYLGAQLLEAGLAENAYAAFVAGEDPDGQAGAAFAAGEAIVAGMEPNDLSRLTEALRWYKLAPELPETEERTSMIARSLLNMEEDSLSEQYASVVTDSEASQGVLYALALRSLERKDEASAMRQLRKAGDNADASERFREMLDARVNVLIAAEKFDQAIFLCTSYGVEERADEIRGLKALKEEEERQKALKAEAAEKAAKAEEAGRLLAEARYDEAAALYTEIGDTEQAAAAIAEKEAAEAAIRAQEEAARLEAERAEKERIRAVEEKAAALLDAGSYDEAAVIFRELNEPDMVSEAIYRKAAALNMPDLYMEIPEYKDSHELHYRAGKALLDTDPETAFRILADDIAYSDVQAVLYGLADRESKAANYGLSSAIFETLSRQPLDPQNPLSDCGTRGIQDLYQYGLQLQALGSWDAAAAVFDRLSGIGSAREHAFESRYAAAAQLEEGGKFSQAAVAFDEIAEYSDSAERANRNRFSMAQKLFEAGDLENARKAFADLGSYGRAAEMEKECRYLAAEKLLDAEKWEDARAIYSALGGYSDSPDKTMECIYQLALLDEAQSLYSEAIEKYVKISGYMDASDRLRSCRNTVGAQWVEKAEAALPGGEFENAVSAYRSAHEEFRQADNTEMAESIALKIADCYRSVNDLDNSLSWYRQAGSDGKLRIVEIAEYAFLTEQYKAAEALALETDTEAGGKLLYRMAEDRLSDGDDDAALRLFSEAGDTPGAAYQHDSILYRRALSQFEQEDYLAALNTLDLIPEYDGVAEKKQETLYAIAVNIESTEGMDPETRSGVNRAKLIYVDNLVGEKEYAQAISVLEKMDQTDEAVAKTVAVKYTFAEVKEAEGDYEGALAVLRDMKQTAEVVGRIIELEYRYAEAKESAGDYEGALAILAAMDQTPEVTERISGVKYRFAAVKETSGDYAGAVTLFASLGGYQDAASRTDTARFRLAAACRDDGDYDRALEQLKQIPAYEGARDMYIECLYLKAGVHTAAGEYHEAFAIYHRIQGYRDVTELLTGTDGLRKELAAWQHSIGAGSRVAFGHRTNGDPLYWIVLDRDGAFLFLFAERATDTLPFYTGNASRTTWQHSTLRTYLNGEFLSSAFSEDERKAIRLSKVKAEKTPKSDVSPGNNTEDYIYLLNHQELERYTSIISSMPKSDAWWLRSPTGSSSSVKSFQTYTKAGSYSFQSAGKPAGVRPVLWVADSIFLALAEKEETDIFQDPESAPEADAGSAGDANATASGRPKMGITVYELTADDVKDGWPCRGLLILEVEAGGPAETAGLKAGDIIVGVNAKTITTFADLEKYLDSSRPGNTPSVKYRHATKFQENADGTYTFNYESTRSDVRLTLK